MTRVRSEIQLVSMLIGMFWEVEHGALYKPEERLRQVEISVRMQQHYGDVIRALNSFEDNFEVIATAASRVAKDA